VFLSQFIFFSNREIKSLAKKEGVSFSREIPFYDLFHQWNIHVNFDKKKKYIV
jgi:hypothetical protein